MSISLPKIQPRNLPNNGLQGFLALESPGDRRRVGRQTKPRSQKMSTFNISDITLAGAYANAVTAAKDSDRRNAGRRLETGEGWNVIKFFQSHARRFVATTEVRRAADQLTARPV